MKEKLILALFLLTPILIAEDIMDIVNKAEEAITIKYQDKNSSEYKSAMHELRSIMLTDKKDNDKIAEIRGKYLSDSSAVVQMVLTNPSSIKSDNIKDFRKKAENDFPDAQFALGLCYMNGYGLKKDTEEAIKWFQKSADLGFAEAQCMLGKCYQEGIGVSKMNLYAAEKWYKKAIESGNPEAQFRLGLCYYEEKLDPQNNPQYALRIGAISYSTQNREIGKKMILKSAEGGFAEAQNKIGDFHYRNYEYEEAFNWFRKAAEQGHIEAQLSVAKCYNEGKGVSQNPKEAVKWFKKVADQGDVKAQYVYAISLLNGSGIDKNEKEAIKWLKKAAEHDNIDAQRMLGDCYRDGRGVPQDHNAAKKYYPENDSHLEDMVYFDNLLEKAEKGNVDAQYELANCFKRNVNSSLTKYQGQTWSEAVKWYRKAAEQGDSRARFIVNDINKFEKILREAEQGDADAQYQIAESYSEGETIQKNNTEAVKWYRKAAEQGHILSQYKLGVCYRYGTGCETDIEEAKKWLKKASMQGNKNASNYLNSIEIWGR